MEKDFKRISPKKLKNFTMEEKIRYYNQLRDYYLSLPYDNDLKNKKADNFLKAAKVIISITDWLYNPKPINNENEINRIDGKGIIYISNHQSSLDQFPLISAIGKGKPLVVLAKNTLLKLKRGILYKYVGCEFIDLDNIRSTKQVLEVLAKDILHGRDVLIFPEGTRNTTGNYMLDFKLGAVILAQETGTKIVPYAINEDYKIFKENYLYVRRGQEFNASLDDDIIEANEKLQEIVRTLIWENMELERSMRINNLNKDIREEAYNQFVKKRDKLENQRKKLINKKDRKYLFLN
ncbi:MAG: 1-acyl-sn-glycerol-3-phosphate acyltransferase [Clostridium sp.]|nr:1-acyl-sn-glycerol-3-phosphate acyltransferase [Clostridium sp.]MCM1444555.1 1-acyl-sn-glycerol-3-phosphate acyltransferase [Candidatus Amulumruptor caecigallinarius]